LCNDGWTSNGNCVEVQDKYVEKQILLSEGKRLSLINIYKEKSGLYLNSPHVCSSGGLHAEINFLIQKQQ
jgi:hypothetical protein